MRTHCFRPHFPAAVDPGLGVAAVAAHIEASSAVGQAVACGMTAQFAGSQSPVLREDEPGRTAAEGSCRASCGVRRGCRVRWRGRDPCRAGRAWSVNRSWYRTPVRADQYAFGKDWDSMQMLRLRNRRYRWRHCLSFLADAGHLIGCCWEPSANHHDHQTGTGLVVALVEDAMFVAEVDTSQDSAKIAENEGNAKCAVPETEHVRLKLAGSSHLFA